MKHPILHTLLILFTLTIVSTRAYAWGETTSYVLDVPSEYTLNTIETGPTLALSGPGATLTYSVYTNTFLGIQGLGGIWVQVSTDGGRNFSDLVHDDVSTSNTTKTHAIDANVTHIRFITKTGATLKKVYSNVKVTRATTLATTTTTLDFGTVTNRRSASLDAHINYNNTTYQQQVTGTCTDPNFTVTPTAVDDTGEGKAIPVIFTPTSAGTHTGTVTLSMNGKTVSFQVTGVGQATYYTRATASATEGGQAYVSFTSFAEATATSATKNSGLTTASSASTTAFYRATANPRYEFVGWKRNLSDATYASTDAEFEAPAYTYNSESSANPTVVTYYAVFQEKPNVITLEPTSSTYDADTYETVTLHRTFLQGYNTIALPFDTDVQALTSRNSADDWVAQLTGVTYNQQDGFTLFFQQVPSGRIHAFQPYVLYLGQSVVDPSWTNITLAPAQPVSIAPTAGYSTTSAPDGSSYADWQMTSNFTAGFSMNGLYGIVNAAGALQRGGSTATLNAFTAYITPVSGAAGVKVQSAFTDSFGRTTIIRGLPASPSTPDAPSHPATSASPSHAADNGVFSLGGQRLSSPQRGINIIRDASGRYRKVVSSRTR